MNKTNGKRKQMRLLLYAACALLTAGIAFSPPAADRAQAARDWGGSMWKIQGGRSFDGQSSGNWRTGIRARADGSAGDTISMGTSESVSNSISANCGISRRVLNATFRFDVSRTWSANASKSYGLSDRKKGTWWAIQYKPVYKNYKVRVRKYTFADGTWKKTARTKWITARKFDFFAYRLVRSKAPK